MTSEPPRLAMQVAPLPGKRAATVLVLVDEAVGVLAEDRALGEEDQHPGDHRGGASGAGSPHNNQENPSILSSLWTSRRPGNPSRKTLGQVTHLSPHLLRGVS